MNKNSHVKCNLIFAKFKKKKLSQILFSCVHLRKLGLITIISYKWENFRGKIKEILVQNKLIYAFHHF